MNYLCSKMVFQESQKFVGQIWAEALDEAKYAML